MAQKDSHTTASKSESHLSPKPEASVLRAIVNVGHDHRVNERFDGSIEESRDEYHEHNVTVILISRYHQLSHQGNKKGNFKDGKGCLGLICHESPKGRYQKCREWFDGTQHANNLSTVP